MRLPKGYGTITKLSGNRRKPYWVRLGCEYTSDGKKLTETRPTLGYYATKTEALEALHAYHRDPYDVSNRSTFADIYDKWITEKSSLSSNTIYSYKAAYAKCQPIWDIPLADLRLHHYQAVLDSVSDQSASTVNNVKVVLSGVSAYGMRHELISKDYTEYVKTAHAESKPIHDVFTPSEIHALWSMTQSIERDITLILLYSGWRIRELLEMPGESIDMTALTMTGGKKTAAGKNRVVPIHSAIKDIIGSYADSPQPFDVRYDHIKQWIKDHTKHLPHDTRHTFISELQDRGADHICIQRLVGHVSDNVTDKVYTHKDIQRLREAIELISYRDIKMLAV